MNSAVTAKHIEHQGPLEIISILKFVVDSAENCIVLFIPVPRFLQLY